MIGTGLRPETAAWGNKRLANKRERGSVHYVLSMGPITTGDRDAR